MSPRNDDNDLFTLAESTVTEQLAEAVGLPVTNFVEVFGAPWRPYEERFVDYDADPSGSGNLFGSWYLAGDPVQLMLRPLEPGEVELAVPVARGGGATQDHVWMPAAERLTLDAGPRLLETAPPVVAALLKRRRSGFRYCRYCRSLTPPEERYAPDVCYGCAGAWLDIVY
jgi:hypothetical protein